MKQFFTLAIIALSTFTYAGPFDKFIEEDVTKQAPSEGSGLRDTLKNASSILVETVVAAKTGTSTEKNYARKQGISVKELQEIQKQEFLESEIKKKELLLEVLKSKMIFVKKEKKIFIKKHNEYKDIFIPFNNQTTLEFDQEILEIKFLRQDNIDIKRNDKNKKIIDILNKNPNLLINLRIVFMDEMIVNLVVQTGTTTSKRYIDFKIFSDAKSLARKALLLKPTKVKTIHNDFNNKAIHLIISRLQKNIFYKTLVENMTKVDKVLFSGITQIEGINGLETIEYTMRLNTVFESPFVKTSKEDNNKRRLIMLELEISNDSNNKTLMINETILKNRFPSLVAAWVGDLDRKDNVISPGQQIIAIIVIEDIIRQN
jgi:hypothetical protein